MCIGYLLVVTWAYGRLSHARGPLPIGLRGFMPRQRPSRSTTNKQPTYTFNQPCIQPSIYPTIRPSTHPHFHSPIHPFTHPSIHLSIHSPVHSPPIYPPDPSNPIHPFSPSFLSIHSSIHSSSQASILPSVRQPACNRINLAPDSIPFRQRQNRRLAPDSIPFRQRQNR